MGLRRSHRATTIFLGTDEWCMYRGRVLRRCEGEAEGEEQENEMIISILINHARGDLILDIILTHTMLASPSSKCDMSGTYISILVRNVMHPFFSFHADPASSLQYYLLLFFSFFTL